MFQIIFMQRNQYRAQFSCTRNAVCVTCVLRARSSTWTSVHDKESNNLWSNDAQFMHKLSKHA